MSKPEERGVPSKRLTRIGDKRIRKFLRQSAAG